jgi:hypothetical protein
MDRICVYCGSRPGRDETYRRAARAFGRTLADRGVGVVYGGGQSGVMGALADATLSAGGEVYGVIPAALVDREAAHDGLTDLEVVESMHERKARMADRAEGFVALPGGLGTLEEIVEMATWAQLGFHDHPCGLLNVAGYFDDLIDFLDHATEAGFLGEADRGLLAVDPEGGALLDAMSGDPE